MIRRLIGLVAGLFLSLTALGQPVLASTIAPSRERLNLSPSCRHHRLGLFLATVLLALLVSPSPAGATRHNCDGALFAYDEPAYVAPGANLASPVSGAPVDQRGSAVASAAGTCGHVRDISRSLLAPSGAVTGFVQSAASSRRLGDNLVASGVTRPSNSAAHHIVAGNASGAAEARATLSRFGIDVNSADNGVFLPLNTNVANPTGAAVHSTVHTNAYYAGVNDLLGQATTRAEAVQALGAIRSQLLSGGFP